MIDIGPNLTNEQFKNDLEEVLKRAKNNNISHLILTSTDMMSFKKNIDIIKKYNNIIPMSTTYGLHPHNAKNNKDIFDNIDKYLSYKEVISIGEFGLDYFRMLSSKETQLEIMEKFLISGHKNPDKSLFLHERDAFNDFYSLLKNKKGINKSVVHCFTGKREHAIKYLDIGCYIGITGWISDKRRNQDLVEALKFIPIEKIMIETDSPYLTPHNMPKREKRNEPSNLKYIAKSIAEIKNIEIQEVVEKTFQNTLDFFSLNDYNNINKQQMKKI